MERRNAEGYHDPSARMPSSVAGDSCCAASCFCAFPSSSKMRRLHLGLGHLISSICHRLLYSTPASNRPYFPPPVLICNKGTSLPLPIPLYHLCFIGFLPAPDSPICRKAGDACPALSGCSLLGICNG